MKCLNCSQRVKKIFYMVEACPNCGDTIPHTRQKPKTVTMTEIENAVGDTSEEYTEGVVELFESKGFTVEV